MPLFLSGWSPTTCDHTAPRSRRLGSNAAMSAGDGRTIELRIHISRRGGGSARCSGSRARVQPRNFFPPTPPSPALAPGPRDDAVGVEASFLFTQVTTERLTRLAELADRGALKVHVDRTFPLQQASVALLYVEKESPRGKV